MSDPATKTPNFSFQRVGAEVVIAPNDYNSILDTLDTQLPYPVINYATYGTPGTGVAGGAASNWNLSRLRLTLTNAVVSVAYANAYGSLKIFTWPNTNFRIQQARANLTIVKDGSVYLAADTPDVAVGTAAASNSTLATTMINVLEQESLAGTLSATYQRLGAHTASAVLDVAAGTTNYLYLNASGAPGAGSGTGTLTATGNVDLFFNDFGLATS